MKNNKHERTDAIHIKDNRVNGFRPSKLRCRVLHIYVLQSRTIIGHPCNRNQATEHGLYTPWPA